MNDNPEVIDFTGLQAQSPQAGQMGKTAYTSDVPTNWTPILLLGIGLLLLIRK